MARNLRNTGTKGERCGCTNEVQATSLLGASNIAQHEKPMALCSINAAGKINVMKPASSASVCSQVGVKFSIN